MTTVVYNRQSLGQRASVLPLTNIDVRIESEATPEEISQFLYSLAAHIIASEKMAQIEPLAQDEENLTNWSAEDYRRNHDGDEFASCDELGFERSYMGPRADFNHIF